MSSHHHHTTPCCYPPPNHHFHHHHPPDPYPYPHCPPPHQTHCPPPHTLTFQHQEQETIPNSTLSSLLRRIAALETALNRRSISTPSNSLRNAAALIIQTHFRAFLLRRSRTLRQLKDLAFIKSELGFLKITVSEKTHFDYDLVCRKVRILLRKLSHIQGGDPMIRDGKKVVSRDLNRFLDYIDGFYVERRTRVSRYVRNNNNNLNTRVSSYEKDVGNTRGKGSKRDNEEKLRGLAERIDKLAVKIDEEGDEDEDEMGDNRVMMMRGGGGLGSRGGGLVMHKPVKRVSFAEDGKVYRYARKNGEACLDEDNCDDSVDEEDLVDEGEIEEIGLSAKESVNDEQDEVESEEEGSSRSSEGGQDLTSYPRGKR